MFSGEREKTGNAGVVLPRAKWENAVKALARRNAARLRQNAVGVIERRNATRLRQNAARGNWKAESCEGD